MTARGYCWLTFLICFLSVICYCVADSRPEIALLAIVVFGFAAVLTGRGLPVALPRMSINLLVIGATLWVLMRVVGQGVPTVTEMTDFLVWILLIKLFDRGRPRDEGQLLGLSTFVVIGAVLTDNGLGLGLMLLVLTPLIVAAAIGMQLFAGTWADAARRREAFTSAGIPLGQPAPAALGLVPTRRAGRDARRVWLGSVIACTLLSIGAFLLSPRTLTQQVLGSLGEVRSGAQTDFRDSIDLGRGGNIATSDEPVLDLTLRDDQGQVVGERTDAVLLRGAVLDSYDPERQQWKSSAATRLLDVARGGGNGPDGLPLPIMLRGGPAARGEPSGPLITQEIVIRNARDNSPLFAVWRPLSIRIGEGRVAISRDDMVLRHDSQGSSSAGVGRLVYSVTSSPIFTGSAPPPLEALDTSGVAPRVRELALQLARDAGIAIDPGARDTAETRRLASVMVLHLRDRFAYDLEQEVPPAGVDPVEFFLFDRQRGHCEYFAAALTSMLRSVGVPARIVTGYAAGEYNAITSSFVVRKSDAHAWVEAQIRAGRWETLDATPPGSMPSRLRSNSGILARVRQLWDALELSWINNVVAFDAKKKIDLGEALVDHKVRLADVRRSFGRLGDWVSSFFPRGMVGRIGGILLAIATCVFVLGGVGYGVNRVAGWRTISGWLAWLRGGSGHGRRAFRDGPEERALQRVLRALDKAGLAKPEHRPPLEHARVIATSTPHTDLASACAEFARSYYAARFGAGSFTPESSGDARAARPASGIEGLVPLAARIEQLCGAMRAKPR